MKSQPTDAQPRKLVTMLWPVKLWNRARIATARSKPESVSAWVRRLVERELKRMGE